MRDFLRRNLLSGLLVVGLSLVFIGCGGVAPQPGDNGNVTGVPANGVREGAPTEPTEEPAAKELKTVRVVFGAGGLNPMLAGQTIGIPLGYYEEEGLKLEVVAASGGGSSQQTLAGGGAEYAILVAAPFINATVESGDLGIIDVCNMTQQIHWQLAVRPDSDIQSIADFSGKRIGVLSFGDSEYTGIRGALTAEGIDPDRDVEFVAVGYGAQAGNALESGEVDVLAIWDGELATIRDLGYEMRLLPNPPVWNNLFGFGFGVRKEYLQQNPDEVAGFCRAAAKSMVFAQVNPEAAIKLHWQVAPESRGSGTEEEALRKALVPLLARMPHWTPCGKVKCEDFQYGYHYPEKWEATVDFLNLRDKIPDASIFYTNELIEEINDFDIDAIIEEASNFEFEE